MSQSFDIIQWIHRTEVFLSIIYTRFLREIVMTVYFFRIIADGNSKETERHNRANSAVSLARAPAASGHGRRPLQANHHDRAQRYHRSEYCFNISMSFSIALILIRVSQKDWTWINFFVWANFYAGTKKSWRFLLLENSFIIGRGCSIRL